MADDETKRGPDDKQASSPRALEPDAAGNVVIDVIMGPYRNQRLTVPAAEGQAAINDHWARDPNSGVPYGEGHEPLDDEHRAEAMEAANTWAQAQWDAGTQEPPPDPEGGEGETGGVTRRTRAMAPGQAGPGYATRQAQAPTPTPTQAPTPQPRKP